MSIDENGKDQLRAIVERIERLEEEKKALSEDIKEVFAEAKANGYDTKVLRKVLKIRKLDRDEWQEQEAILDLYLAALGLSDGGQSDTPAAEKHVKDQKKRQAARQRRQDDAEGMGGWA